MALTYQQVAERERLAGLVLIGAAILALVAANSGLAGAYEGLLHFKVGPAMPRFGQFSVHYWISEALMAIFFLLVGLEVKREWYEGRLADPARRKLPILAAIGGMLVPALAYLAVVGLDPHDAKGWAIPAATDIAFAIGVLALLGRFAPPSLKVLLVTIAIIDDIGAVAIIALVYTSSLDIAALGIALGIVAGMAVMAMLGVRRLAPYLIGFVALWFAVLASGVHATIAGVLAALTVPLKLEDGYSPLRVLEHAIHPWVMFGIVPLFGFASAGVAFTGGLGVLAEPIAQGVALGLLLGKQLGVFGAIWLAVRFGLAPRPPGVSWLQLYGAAVLCGIGFTMSLFIGALAFTGEQQAIDSARIGTLVGSLASAILATAMFRLAGPFEDTPEAREEASDIFAADD